MNVLVTSSRVPHTLRGIRHEGMTRRLALACVVVLTFVVSIHGGEAPRADAQSTPTAWVDAALAERLSGDWRLAVTPEVAARAVGRGIETAVASLPPLIDAMAARELRTRTPVSSTLWIDVTSARIRTRFADHAYDTAPGRSVRMAVPDEDASSMGVVQLLRSGGLEQIFTTERGRRWNTFTATDDGQRLTLAVVIQSASLPTDVRFVLPYTRAR
ncbi:MAG: hypothetical protein J0L92_41785 [Deltaproteobacteria bacterium]|nr:hypothetical protein [Deltaproteobacteria bacterium]